MPYPSQRGFAVPVTTRLRRTGGGSKSLLAIDPKILVELEAVIAPETRGDPMSPLRWTFKSTSKLAAELTRRRHPVSARTVAAFLKAQDYSTQGTPLLLVSHRPQIWVMSLVA